MPEPNEQYIVRFSAETNEYMRKLLEFEAATTRAKDKMFELSKTTSLSWKKMAQAMVTQDVEQIRLTPYANIEEQQKDIQMVKAAYKAAYADIMADEKAMAAHSKQMSKETSQEKINAIKQEIAAQKEYMAAVKSGNVVMSDAARQQGQIIQDTANKIRQIAAQTGLSYKQVGQQLVQTGTPIHTVNNALKTLQTTTTQTASSFGVLTTAARTLMAVLGIYGLIQVLQKLSGAFMSTIKSGLELAKGMFKLEIGIRALQRTGIEITLQDVYDNLERLQQRFGIFSKKELIEGASAFMNLNRDMGFTREQLFKLQEAIATLAIVNGRAMDEVQRTVALALASGYTEGLQRLGVSINRVTISMKAATLGYKGGYMALTETQRALSTYLLILEKTAKYEEDLLEYQKTAPGMIDTTTAKWKDFTSQLGLLTIPVLGSLANGLNAVLGSLTHFIEKLAESKIGDFIRESSGMIVGFVAMANAIKGGTTSMEKLVEVFNEAKKAFKAGILGDAEVGNIEEKRIIHALEALLDDIEGIQMDSAGKMKDIEIDLQRDLEQIDREGNRRRLELWTDLNDDLAKMARETQYDIEDAWAKYYFDVSQINQDTNDDIADANQKYRDEELDAERRLQEKLRQLREEFLFDLEDALRERDAKQVLRLIRRYNLDREQMLRERELEKIGRDEAHREELEEIRRQRAKRLAELKAELLFRLSEIKKETAREVLERQIQYQQEMLDLQRSLDAQREERLIRYEQQKVDLQTALDEQLAIIAKKLWDELKITGDSMAQVRKILSETLGEGGYAEMIYKYYYDMAVNYISSLEDYALRHPIPIIQTPSTPITPPTTPVTPYAKGGTVIATKPSLALFGERGPEMAQFTPLNNGSDVLKKVALEILLSPGLEAKIVDDALGEMADVVLSIQRERR